MSRHARMQGLLTALALTLGVFTFTGEVFAASNGPAVAVAADDSLDFWLDLLQAESAVVDSLLALLKPAPSSVGTPTGWAWSGSMATGYDTYVQTYFLALEDTSETLSEYELILSAVGETHDASAGAWRLAPQLAVGSERVRTELDTQWQWNPGGGPTRWELGADLQNVHYRGTTAWNLSSDWREADLDLRWRRELDVCAADLRLDAASLRYDAPSELEVSRDDLRATFALKSNRTADDRWKVGLRAGHRAHPDTTAIDRTMWGADTEYEHMAFDGPSLRLLHRSERRTVRDETARPSSWGHWASMEGSWPLAEVLELSVEFDGEVWTYDQATGAYQNQLRWSGLVGLRASAIEGPGWQLGMAVEQLDSDDPEETYSQRGVRAGLESFGSTLTASTTLEVGRRDYAADVTDTASATDSEIDALYTDFTYVELWLNVSWRLNEKVSLDVLGSWLPESHNDDEDDQSLGFGSVRLSYRF